jgi:endonuclease/exonuclease/phosphatase family metal-dependent hydrolase
MRRVRVVSWNVGRIYTPTNNNRLDDADIPRVARVLDELDPDVVLLQEVVTETQLAALLDRLPGYAGALAADCSYDRHVAALARIRLRPAFAQHRLEPTGRGLVAVRFDVPAGSGARGVALPVHFDVFDKLRRRSQAEAVIDLARGCDEVLSVVGGDFNLDPDVAEKLGDALDRGTFNRFTEHFVDDGRAAGPTLFGVMRVDHLFARGSALDRVYARVSPGRRLPLGDHDPLVGDLELTKGAVDAARRKP